MERRITLSHFPKTHEEFREPVMKILERNYDKLEQFFPGELTIAVHFKEARKEGHRELVEARARATGAGHTITSHHSDWSIELAAKHAMRNLETEIKKIKEKGKKS